MKHLKTPQELNKVSENLNISDVRSSRKLHLITFKWEDGDIMGKILLNDTDKTSIVSSVDKLMGKDYFFTNTRDREFNDNYGKYFDMVNWRWVNYEIETIDVL
jgi:hypothetical protein